MRLVNLLVRDTHRELYGLARSDRSDGIAVLMLHTSCVLKTIGVLSRCLTLRSTMPAGAGACERQSIISRP